jgi:hypothetical protein
MRIMIPLPIMKTDSLKTAWAQLPEEAKPETREVIKDMISAGTCDFDRTRFNIFGFRHPPTSTKSTTQCTWVS